MIWNPKRQRQTTRRHRPEKLEPRRLLAADPINLGLVYLETDYLESDQDMGSDSRGDRFLLSFTGGAPDTQLREVRINTDKDGDGITIGDSIYDTASGGFGKSGSHGFELLSSISASGKTIEVIPEVEDGSQELILRLQNFYAGDRIEFSIDVDEVLRIASDPAIFNDRLDVITSGQEFQDSILEVTFEAPHFETSHADAVFINDYGDPWNSTGIDLPPDQGEDLDSRPNRSAAANVVTTQTPKPIELTGQVWVDNDLDAVRAPDEAPLEGIELVLWKQDQDGQYVDTGLRALTDAEGRYAFSASLGLSPGRYQVTQIQPEGWWSVAAVPGQLVSPWTQPQATGLASSVNTLTDIEITHGDMSAIELNFAEAMPSALSGFVYADRNENGVRDEGELAIEGVGIALVPVSTLGTQPRLVTQTDASGFYSFEGLSPGTYQVIQLDQPADYFDGRESLGTIDGNPVGSIDPAGDAFVDIVLRGDENAIEFNFGEIPFSSLSGSVVISPDGADCQSGEPASQALPIAGVVVELQTIDGALVARTTTDAEGRYTFDQLASGVYRLIETTPEGLIDGNSHAGIIGDKSVGVAVDGGLIDQIQLPSGVAGTDFVFCEIRPSSLGGRVWKEITFHDESEPQKEPLPGVEIELTNDRDEVIGTTVTDANGHYIFDGLPPGQYGVRQTQPRELFHGSERQGDAGGRIVGDNTIVDIRLEGGTDASGYDFWELPPATLSGFVFQDGQPLAFSSPPGLAQLRQLRDGVFSDDDASIEGVWIELLDEAGRPVDASDVLPDFYSDGLVHAVTDADGRYVFEGLRPGIYHVLQHHPADYLDSFDSPGTTGGIAAGAALLPTLETWHQVQQKLMQFGLDGHSDVILSVPVFGGQHSEHNNFSEVLLVGGSDAEPPGPDPVDPPPVPEPEPDPVTETPPEPPEIPVDPPLRIPPPVPTALRPPASRIVPTIETFHDAGSISTFDFAEGPQNAAQYANDWAVSWHLSVINAGYPRGVMGEDGAVRAVNFRHLPAQWQEGEHSRGRWTVGSLDGTFSEQAGIQLGAEQALALTGDFDGDGLDEAVIYVRGQWFVDLNGNGRWDEGDLWIQLGTELDRPVVGDWDGDGKDDVGIFGRQWADDAHRITVEPGLPDPANTRRRRMRVMAASARAASEPSNLDRPRLLRRGSDGPLRADAVDHVFQYGNHVDTPVSGDWNGDGIDQIAAFRNGQWLLDSDGDGRWSGEDERLSFGRAGDQPIVGDFNGDQIDEIGVVRGDLWIIDIDGDRRLTGNDLQIRVPRTNAESQPVVGDWDGDGKDEPGYYETRQS